MWKAYMDAYEIVDDELRKKMEKGKAICSKTNALLYSPLNGSHASSIETLCDQYLKGLSRK
jgi:hypothetical protein